MDLFQPQDNKKILQQNIYQLATFPVIGAGLQFLYGQYIEKRQFGNVMDGILMGASLFGSKLLAALIDSKITDQFGNAQINMIYDWGAQPLINAFLYDFLFSRYFEPQYKDFGVNRGNMNLYLGAGYGLASSLSDKIILSMFFKSA